MAYSYDDYLQQFISYLTFEKRYSKLTVQAYNTDLEQFFLFIQLQYPTLQLITIKHTHIRSWLASAQQDKKGNTILSSRSINRKISTLKSFFKFCCKQKLIEVLPTEKLVSPKNSKRLPAYLQENQMVSLLEEIDFGTDFAGLTKRIIIEILYCTGMRRAELVNLQPSQIDFSGQLIKVIGKGNKERYIPMMPQLANLLKQYFTAKAELEFADNSVAIVMPNGKKMYDKYVYNIATQYIGLVTTQPKKSPHILRHTFATSLLENGAELNAIKELLGHASLAATQVYTHNSIEKLKKVFEKAHPKS